jgi:hypothetical protein
MRRKEREGKEKERKGEKTEAKQMISRKSKRDTRIKKK